MFVNKENDWNWVDTTSLFWCKPDLSLVLYTKSLELIKTSPKISMEVLIKNSMDVLIIVN